MKTLFQPILINTFRKKSVWLFWLFALSPFVVMIAMSINSSFLQISGEAETLSSLEFFSMFYGVLHNSTLPMIILAFIVSSLFYEEVNDGILFMFKDISKTKILLSKWLTLFIMHAFFLAILLISTMIVYFTYLTNYEFASGTLFPISAGDIATVLVPTLGMYFIEVITITVAIALSINLSTGWTILGTLIFILFTSIAPLLKTAKYIVPNGYDEMIGEASLGVIMLIISSIFLIYFFISLFYSMYKYKRIEY